MSTRLRHRLLRALPTLLAVGIGLLIESRPAIAVALDEVLRWNMIATTVGFASGKSGVPQSRIYAMVQLAIHDALNAIDHRYSSYAFSQEADPTASAPAAIATAAHDVLVHELPLQAPSIDAEWNMSLGLIAPSSAKDSGVTIGHASAAAMLALRSNDGSAIVTTYIPGGNPGDWRPTPNPDPPSPNAPGLLPAAFPGWGNVTPFVLANAAQFRPDRPPELTSEQYTQDYDEVNEIGEQFSTLRTIDQSAIARFWYEPSPIAWSRISRTLAVANSLDSWESARLLALVNVAMADGFIAGFNAKYYFNFWRPITAIREADSDANDNTVSDSDWNTYLNTPNVPDYPSTHSVLGAAAAEVLARFFGTDDISFSTTSGAPFPGITRSFTSLSQAANENGDSRVYAGIHFRSAVRDGIQQGRKIGKFTVMHYLKPLDSHGGLTETELSIDCEVTDRQWLSAISGCPK